MSDVKIINSIKHSINYDDSLDNTHWQSDIFVREKSLVDHLKKVLYYLEEYEIRSALHAFRK